MDRPRLLCVAVVLTALGSAGAASAQDRKVEICSAGKKAWRVAVAFDMAEGRRVEGWYDVPLGGCVGLTVPVDSTVYYFGTSTDGERVWPIPGLTNTRYCVQPRKAKFFYIIRKSRLEDAHKATRCADDPLGPRGFVFHFPGMGPRIEMSY